MNPKVKEIHSVYIDNLEEWIDVPVYDDGDLGKITAGIDWDGLSLVEYKKLLINHIDLESRIRSRVNSYIVRDEIYEHIIRRNPGLKPKIATVSGLPFYTPDQEESVREWFNSYKLRGTKPQIVQDESS